MNDGHATLRSLIIEHDSLVSGEQMKRRTHAAFLKGPAVGRAY